MAEIYQDKNEAKIKQDVSEQFKRDDTLIRDDYQLYGSAIKVIDTYLDEIKKSDKEKRGSRAIKGFTDLKDTLTQEMKAMTGRKLFTENQKVIQELANRIDDAEKIVLERLALNRANAKTIDAINASEETKSYFTTDESGMLTFTAASNQPKIQEVLGKVFKEGHNTYKIDYSGCTNQKIKDKMKAEIGTDQCRISYDELSKTYLLKDKEGKPLPSRALIREGVKILPEAVIAFQSIQESEKQVKDKTESLLNKKLTASEQKELEKMIPVALRTKLNTLGVLPEFLSKVDRRLGEIIVDAKKNEYELRQDPVSKVYASSGLMEMHFMYNDIKTSESIKKDVKVREDEKQLGEKLYDLLDGDESALKTYLEARIHMLRDGYDHLTKRSDILKDANDDKDRAPEQEQALLTRKENVRYSLTMLQKVLENLREKEGTSRDDDEKEFSEMLKFVRDGLYSLDKHVPTESQIQSQIINPLKNKRESFQYDNRATWRGDPDRIFSDIFSDDKNRIIKGLRDLGQGSTVFGNTHTSFLSEEIVKNSGDLEIKNGALNTYFQDLTKKLDMAETDDESLKNEKRTLIDGLYTQNSGGEILNFLISQKLLPADRAGDKEVIKECAKIKDILDQKKMEESRAKEMVANVDEYAREQIRQKKSELEKKIDKTESELQELQAFTFLLDNPDQASDMFETVKQNIVSSLHIEDSKYMGIGGIVRGSLIGSFVDQGGGAKGTNVDILDDIYGVGRFNLSDENAAELGPIITEIIITIVVTVVLTLLTGAGGAAFLAGRAALQSGVRIALKESAKAAGKQLMKGFLKQGLKQGAEQVLKQSIKQTIRKSIQNTTKALAEQGWKEASKQVMKKTLLRGGKLLLREAPTFNALTQISHNALGSKDLLEGVNANVFSKENIQTAAFLMVLHAFNAPGSVLRAGKPIEMNLRNAVQWGMSKGLPITAEFGAMLGAEQAMNLMFGQPLLDDHGRPVIDETTGEMVMDRGFHMPDGMAASQILGMVLAFKIPMVNKMITKWSDHSIEIIDTKTGQRQLLEVDSRLQNPKNGRIKDITQEKTNTQTNTSKKTGVKSSEAKADNKRIEQEKENAIERMVDTFDKNIMSPEGIAIDGKVYKLVYEPNMTQNTQRKGVYKFIVDGKVELSVKAETEVLPDNANGKRIKDRYYELRKSYVEYEIAKAGKEGKTEEAEKPIVKEEEKPAVKEEEKPAVKEEVEAESGSDHKQIQIRYIDKPLERNFTEQEWVQFRDELISVFKNEYPDRYKEIADYRFEYTKDPILWGQAVQATKTILVNPTQTRPAPGMTGMGADIPIESIMHEVSHIITEKNLDLGHLFTVMRDHSNYRSLDNIANSEQQLFMKLSDIYAARGQTFCQHATHGTYTVAEGEIWGKILPVREDMVELNAKYRRGELETFLNERASQMVVSKGEVDAIVKGFKDAFGTEANTIPAPDAHVIPSFLTKIDPMPGELLEQVVSGAKLKAGPDKAVMISEGEVFIVDKTIGSKDSVEMRFADGSVEIGQRQNGKLEAEGVRIDKNGDRSEGIFKEGKILEGKIISRGGAYEVKDGNRILSLHDRGMTYLAHQESVEIQYNNEPLDIKLSADHTLQLVKISDYPELVSRYKINPYVDYLIVDRNLFRSTNGKRGFKALRDGEEVVLGRGKPDRFDFTDDQHVSREHLTITREGDRMQIIDHSLNGTRISRDFMSRDYRESKNTDVNERAQIEEYRKKLDTKEQSNMNIVMQKYPEAPLSYLKNKVFIEFVKNGLRNVDVLPSFDFKQQCPFPEITGGGGELDAVIKYLNDPKITANDLRIADILSQSFAYKNTNKHYCTAAIPTFISSILSGEGVRFVDNSGNSFYTKMDAKIKTSLKISKDGTVIFGGVSDLLYKIGRFASKNNKEGMSIEQMNAQLKDMGLQYSIKKLSNGMLEIESRDNIGFEAVRGENSNFKSFWGYEGMSGDLYGKFTEVVKNIDNINIEGFSYDGMMRFLKKLQKVVESSQFSYGRDNYGLNSDDSFNLDNIDFDYMIRVLENPGNTRIMAQILRDNIASSNIEKIYMIMQQFHGLKSQASSRNAA